MSEIIDYQTLKLVWWLFVGVLLIGFAIMDGFDMGVTTLLPFLGKTDDERRVIINSVGPVWEGNQTWLITAGGAIFAAWPLVYAAAFSGLYVALLLVLFALFFRPVGFDYRSKMESPAWRNGWDWALFVGGFVPSLVFGVAFGNLLLGLPFHYDDTLRSFYTGSFWALLNPFALLCGLVSLTMLLMHGAIYLQLRTEGVVQKRAARAARISGITCAILFALAGLWLAAGIEGYRLLQIPDVNSAINPLHKTVEKVAGAWLSNYSTYPWMTLAPTVGFAGIALALLSAAKKWERCAFVFSSLALAGIILTAGFSMFPFIMPSSTDPVSSLTLWDAVSSKKTLGIMFVVTLIFLPLILIYTSWVFRVLRGKITVQHIRDNSHTAY
ncbi:cytochrome bd-I ubiquinol oxidase subunit 2 apoprotein [Methylovorus glucosotrophus]|uniref:cytochrome d ubiquinol oxidase subunit II n=1 Tax=Methylovorus glucosotrophus TaxID=266009 RepID=UPI0013315090|nr:cytochrome d ubiquinol oxidase subunit II [Methylovorus glucosotrophus]KAF0836392.1 cytochrome bd-I ubiquinol oxidase subunit 2 apoprotein [Methylovorus glucosotrophus]